MIPFASWFGAPVIVTSDDSVNAYVWEKIATEPFWWLNFPIGRLFFVMSILTWGLVLVVLALTVLYLVKKVFGKQ